MPPRLYEQPHRQSPTRSAHVAAKRALDLPAPTRRPMGGDPELPTGGHDLGRFAITSLASTARPVQLEKTAPQRATPEACPVQRVKIEEVSDKEGDEAPRKEGEDPAKATDGAAVAVAAESGLTRAKTQAMATDSHLVDDLLLGFTHLILPAAIAWQTYREHSGQQPTSRGNSVLVRLLTELDAANASLIEHTHTAVKATHFYQDPFAPFTEGLKAGLNPMPMPVAKLYAPWQSVKNALFQAVFLVTATKKELASHQTRVAALALSRRSAKPATPTLEGAPHETTEVLDSAVGKRNDAAAGFATGAVGSSVIMSKLPAFSSPVMQVQFLWDGYHVANGIAVHTETAMGKLQASQRRVMAASNKMMVIQGKQKIIMLAPRLIRLFLK